MPAQRSGAVLAEIQVLRDVQHKSFIRDDAFRVSAVSQSTAVFIRGIVSKNRALLTELFEIVLAIFTRAAGIHYAADTGDVAFLETPDLRADFRHAADNFVTGHARIGGAVPFVSDGMHVRMTDSAIKNLYLYVVRAGITALNFEGRQRRPSVLYCVRINFHKMSAGVIKNLPD